MLVVELERKQEEWRRKEGNLVFRSTFIDRNSSRSGVLVCHKSSMGFSQTSKPNVEDSICQGIKKMNDSLRGRKRSRDLDCLTHFSNKSHSTRFALHFLCYFLLSLGRVLAQQYPRGIASSDSTPRGTLDFLIKMVSVTRDQSEDLKPFHTDIQRCLFLRNINRLTNFPPLSSMPFPMPVRTRKGPNSEYGSNFVMAFKQFHVNGGSPLSKRSLSHSEEAQSAACGFVLPVAVAWAASNCLSFLNIRRKTNLDLSKKESSSKERTSKGPIFEDGPNFDMAFKLFHGNDGVVTRYEKRELISALPEFDLAARVASISLLSWNNQKKTNSDLSKKESSSQGEPSDHEALCYGWPQTGNCPVAKSYRAVSSVFPLVAKVLKRPAGAKLTSSPAVVAALAAISETAAGKNPEPQPLGAKIFVIGMLVLAANVPLGIWREHTESFSPSWLAAVLSAVPFISMLGKSVVMSVSAMAFTIGASVLGHVIGSLAERYRLKAVAVKGMHFSETRVTSSSQEWALQLSGGINGRKFFFKGRINSAKSHSCT